MSILAMIAAAALISATPDITFTLDVETNDMIVFMSDNPETVQTVTNVVEEWFCPKCYVEPGYISIGKHKVWRAGGGIIEVVDEPCPRTIKRVTTTVKRIYTLTLTYRGKERKLVHEEIVSVTVKKYAKKEEWEEVQ